MIEDEKPMHWPLMLPPPKQFDEQTAVRILADVRRLIVEYRKRRDKDWRVSHAQSDSLVNVVAGLIADAEAIGDLFDQTESRSGKLEEANRKLRDELAESKRPFSAQMEMQNRRIIALTAELDQLRMSK